MTAATTRIDVSQHGAAAIPRQGGGGLKTNKTGKYGWSMAYDGDGFLVPYTATTGLKSAGLALADFDSTGIDDGVKVIQLLTGVVDRENGTGADELDDGDIGAVVYGPDNQTANKTDGGGLHSILGIFWGLNPENGKARVLVGPLAIAMAEAIDPLVTLASTANGDGASLIGVEDAAGEITATDVEAALAELALKVVHKKTVTVGHADLTDADTTQDINIGTALPANARIVGVDMRAMTAFSGGGTGSQTVDIGTSGDVDALIDGADLFAAVVDGGPATMPQGIRPNKTFVAGGAQLVARFICDTTQAAFTAGAVTIDVLYVVLA